MRASAALLILIAAALPLAAALGASADDPRDRLAAARAASAAAALRADTLQRQADAEGDAAGKAATQAAAAAARLDQAEADLAAGRARLTAIRALLREQRMRLAAQQAPVARLLAALTAMSRRPAVLSLVQPGSIDDLVHVRAVLAGAMPVIATRTAGLRVELDRSRDLADEAGVAAAALVTSREQLATQRIALARAEAEHRQRQQGLGRAALAASDKALAMGERARDLVDLIDATTDDAATERSLVGLPALTERPGAGIAVPLWGPDDAPYRLPLRGAIVTGFGEVSEAGVRSRGLTIAAAGDAVVAPAAGRIAFAGRFRDYRTIVIIDHGGGWTTLLTGLDSVAVKTGAIVAAGQLLGQAPGGDQAAITVELRRRDRPVDLVPLLG